MEYLHQYSKILHIKDEVAVFQIIVHGYKKNTILNLEAIITFSTSLITKDKLEKSI